MRQASVASQPLPCGAVSSNCLLDGLIHDPKCFGEDVLHGLVRSERCGSRNTLAASPPSDAAMLRRNVQDFWAELGEE
jgi:hypothetical protein